MNLKKYKLWVLDYDGGLLDSMPYWKNAASEYIRYLGMTPKEDLNDHIGIFTEAPSARFLSGEYNLKGSLVEVLRDIDSFVDTFYPYIPLKEGAIELLSELKKNQCILVLVSGSSGHIISLNLKEKGIRNYFDGVYSVYNHPALSKANGGIFKTIEDRFGISRDEMIMIDDSLSNINGANEFGIDTIAVSDKSNERFKEELMKVSLGYMTIKEIVSQFK